MLSLPRRPHCEGPPYGIKGGLRPSPTAISTLDPFGLSLEPGLYPVKGEEGIARTIKRTEEQFSNTLGA